ncbi:MAG: hypothetical protein K0S44_1009 [Bacteroidetes bacterium]|jgi:L-ascorbate metabolism protein UlaG (beta-lactamase superfamily)|nr:hypothetical protein [Bacteroidota bacterium]
MKIEFVNHSSFIVEHNGIRVICDPWLEGSVFNNGWNLIAPSKFTYEDFKTINYIWFSHEHPDHFYPPNIKLIPQEHKSKITVLFQHTIDKRVFNWCKKNGFKDVIELYPNKWINLTPDLEVLCEHFDEGDSWIAFRSEKETLLNSNDCGIRNKAQAEKILKKTGKIDVLLTQFSYAYWAGNPEEREFRKKVADDKLNWMKFQCDYFKPKYVIPIASYIYFSHVENEYLNDEVNTASKTYEFLKKNTDTSPVVLYNGDKWIVGEPHQSEESILKYKKDFDLIKQKQLYHQTNNISLDQLIKEAQHFIEELSKNNMFYLKWSLKPCRIYIKDHAKAFKLDLNSFSEIPLQEEDCDVSITSENLSFCFSFPYGLDTTQINGRLRKPKKGNYSNFYNFFRIDQLKSRGINPNSPAYLFSAMKRKILNKLGFYNQ